jgi:hypothetical protein
MNNEGVFKRYDSDIIIYNKNNLEIVEDDVGNFIIRTPKYVISFWRNGVTFYKRKEHLNKSDYVYYREVSTRYSYDCNNSTGEIIIVGKMPYSFMDKIKDYKNIKSNEEIDSIMERFFKLVVFS